MGYDLNTHNKSFADVLAFRTDEKYSIDDTDKPLLYQFFNLSEEKLKKAGTDFLMGFRDKFELRDSSTGKVVWPADGISLEHVLDI